MGICMATSMHPLQTQRPIGTVTAARQPGHSGSRDPFILRRVLRLQAQHVKLPFLDLFQTRKEVIEVVRDREKPPRQRIV